MYSRAVAVPLPAAMLGIEQNTVLYVLLFPDGRLVVRQAAGGCGVIVNEDDPPYQVVLWSTVIDEVDPNSGQVNGIALDGGVRAKVADAAEEMPEVYPDNPVAAAVLQSLGGPMQPRRGTVAIVAEEEPETGLTGSLSEEQLFVIAWTHRLAVGVPAVVNDLRARLMRGRARTLTPSDPV